MSAILSYIQITLSVLLVAGVLLQRSEASLGSAFGSEMNTTRYARRGLEKILFHGTIIVAILFAASALASIILG